MTPAIDAQLHSAATGAEWAWVSTAPIQGMSVGGTLQWSVGALAASDRDEVFPIIQGMGEGTAVLNAMSGPVGGEVTVPIRWVPDRELGLGASRASLLYSWERVGLLARVSLVSASNLGWGSAWSGPRFEGSVSLSTRLLDVEAAGSWGEDGAGARVAAGAQIFECFDIEAVWAHVWSDEPVGTTEVGLGRKIPIASYTLRPFLSFGIGQVPGTPTARLTVDVRQRARAAAEPAPPDPAPTLPEAQQQQVPAPIQEAAPPPAPPPPVPTPEPPPAPLQALQDPLPPPADKTLIPPEDVSQRLDSSVQAAAVEGVVAFLSKHSEVILLELRLSGPCLSDGSNDPLAEAAAADLVSRLTAVGVPQDRTRVAIRQCIPGGKGVRIEAVVVRTQK